MKKPLSMQRRDNAERIAELAGEADQFNAESRAKVRTILDIMAEEDELDIDEALRHYERCCARPLLSLAQDIQRQGMLLQNMVEEIKRSNFPFEDEKELASRLRHKYEHLGLMTVGTIPPPNPHLGSIATWALNKLATLGGGLVKLLAEHGRKLVQELHFEAGTTATLQAQTGTSWTLTVGVELTVSVTKE